MKSASVSKWTFVGSIVLIVILAGLLVWQYVDGEIANGLIRQRNEELQQQIDLEQEKLVDHQQAIVEQLHAGVPLNSTRRTRGPYGNEASAREIERGLLIQLQDPRQQAQAHGLTGLSAIYRFAPELKSNNPAAVEEITRLLHNRALHRVAASLLRLFGEDAHSSIPVVLATAPSQKSWHFYNAIRHAHGIDPDYDLSPFVANYLVTHEETLQETSELLRNDLSYDDLLAACELALQKAEDAKLKTKISQIIEELKSIPPAARWKLKSKPRTNSNGAVVP